MSFSTPVQLFGALLLSAFHEGKAKAGSDCSIVRRVQPGASYVVPRFPPEARYSVVPFKFPYGDHRTQALGSPQQCTWTFSASGNCSLEFTTHYYVRGDVDCDDQYMLIGDEHMEQRICGFKKPAKQFNSTGRHLFLSNYRRNGFGYHPTVASHLGGAVTCVNRTGPPGPLSCPSCAPLANCSCVSLSLNTTQNYTCNIGGDEADGSYYAGDTKCCDTSALSCNVVALSGFLLGGQPLPTPPPNCDLYVDVFTCKPGAFCPSKVELEARVNGGITGIFARFPEEVCDTSSHNCTLVNYICAQIVFP